VAPRLALAIASVGFTLLALEGTLRVVGHVRGLDYRIYLQEFVNPLRIPRWIWNGTGMWNARVAQAFTRYPPFRPGAAELAATSEYSVVYQINAKGLRDRDYDYARRPEMRRALALGDSFTFGVGVAYGERFVDVAEQRLGDVEILDMGVPGYGLDQALVGFVVEGSRYHPDAVVVFLNRYVLERNALGLVRDGVVRIPDDIASAVPDIRSNADTTYLRADDPLLAQAPALVRRSYLLSWLTYRLRLWRLHERLVAADAEGGPTPIQPGTTLVDVDPARQARTTALLTALRDRCVGSDARLIVVNIDDLYRYPWVERIAGVAYHDLADELHARDSRERLRFRFDRHYTAATHRFLGERLAALLRVELAMVASP
jgi:hypothetical protein